ncbi:hypothetical protein HUU59_09865, partial [bacterium]|nr:hypothetical protein [bacterium]
MKFKTLLFAGCILLVSGLANAQFNAIIYNTGCELADACVGGTGYPDGTKTVQIFWDANNNGPTADDVQPVVGEGFNECNFNSLLLNGEEMLGCAGGFLTDPAFTIVTGTPLPSRYWLRVCDDANSIMWISTAFTIANGLNEYDISTIGGWTCVEDTVCGGCQAPPAVQGVLASDNSCANVTISWTA